MNTFSISTRVVGIGLLCLTLAVTGCKKGTDAISPIDGDTPAFVDKNLRITAVTSDPVIDIDGDGYLDNDLMEFMRPCDVDNTIRFERGGKLGGDNGSVQCVGDDTDATNAKPGSWTYNAKTNILRLTTHDGNETTVSDWEILESSATSVKARVAADGPTDSFRMIMTWKAR